MTREEISIEIDTIKKSADETLSKIHHNIEETTRLNEILSNKLDEKRKANSKGKYSIKDYEKAKRDLQALKARKEFSLLLEEFNGNFSNSPTYR